MSNTLPAQNGLLARASMEYARHQPEQTLLYQVIDEYYPKFLDHLSESDKSLPQYVQAALKKSGRLKYLWEKMRAYFFLYQINSWEELYTAIANKFRAKLSDLIILNTS